MIIMDLDGFPVAINHSWTRVLGWTADELMRMNMVDLAHVDDRERVSQIMTRMVQDRSAVNFFESRTRHKDGQYVWIAWSGRVGQDRFFAIGRPSGAITNKLAMFEKLEAHARIGGWTLDVATMETHWTAEVWRIHELEPGQRTDAAQGISFYHPDDRARITERVTACIQHGRPWAEDFRFITAKGSHRWVRSTGEAVRDSHGRVVSLEGTFQDVSERKALELSLATKVDEFNRIIQTVPGMVYQFRRDVDGTYLFPYVNDKAFAIYEVAPEEFLKDPALMFRLAHENDLAGLIADIERSFKELSPFKWRGRIRTGTGKVKWVLAYSTPHRDESGGTLWNGILVDISREVELEHELAHQMEINAISSRMAAVGQLAAGVGHEINNPLTIAIGMVRSLERKLKAGNLLDDELAEVLRRHDAATERIRKIVEGLRTLSRGSEDQIHIGDLRTAVSGTADLLREMFRSTGIALVLDCGTTEGPVLVPTDITRLQQLVLNLLTNARDALLGNAAPEIKVRLAVEGQKVVLTVSDNGHGIDPSIRDRIFNSFFTTKPVGHGTGLGLALSHAIVSKARGRISFDSTVGRGTTFRVEFPLVTETGIEEAKPDTHASGSTKVGCGERVLVVDDEPVLCELLETCLVNAGFSVRSATSANDALKILAKEQFDVLLTDFRMPGMDGLELIARAGQDVQHANMRRILVTGGSQEDYEERIAKLPSGKIDGLLPKPVGEEQVIAAIVKSLKLPPGNSKNRS